MKRLVTFCLVLGIALPLGGQAPKVRLEGCPTPQEVSAALVTLQEDGWQNISLPRLQTLWPTHLEAVDCDTKTCRSVRSEDRIIRGECECCTLFYFDVSPTKDAEPTRGLHSIIIHYSAHHRQEAVAAARLLAKAAGLDPRKAIMIGGSSVQNFEWESGTGGKQESFGVEVRLTRHGDLWKAYLHISRGATGAISSAVGQDN